MGAYLLSPTLLFLVVASLSSAWVGALPSDPEALNDYITYLTNKEKLLGMQEEELRLREQILALQQDQLKNMKDGQASPVGQAANAVSSKEHTDGGRVVFHDDFDAFNLSVWKHEITLGGGGNWEFQYYVNNRSNSFVRDGVLFLQPTLTADRLGKEQVSGAVPFTLDLWGTQPADLCTGQANFGCLRTSSPAHALNPIQSARLRTAGTFSFKYGRLEVVAKLPRGDWLWPAIWLLPEEQYYGAWPSSGEIDVMESRGNGADYPAGGVDTVTSTLHYGPFFGADGYLKAQASVTTPANQGTFADDFHTYGLFWNESVIYTYIDDDAKRLLWLPIDQSFWDLGSFQKDSGRQLDNPWEGRPPVAPFDQPFYLVLNVAVGGTNGYFPDGVGGKPWSDKAANAFTQFAEAEEAWLPTWREDGGSAMLVDSVTVWQYE